MKQVISLGRYETKRFFKNTLKIFAAALVFSTLMAFLSRAIVTISFESEGLWMTPNSAGMFLMVGFIILPLIDNKKSFNFHIQNGFIRRDIFMARHISFFINAILFATINGLISILIYFTPFNDLFVLKSLGHILPQTLLFALIYYILASLANFYAILYNKLGLTGIIVMILITNIGGRLIYPLFNAILPNVVAWLSKIPPQGEVSVTYVVITFLIIFLVMNSIAFVVHSKTEVSQ